MDLKQNRGSREYEPVEPDETALRRNYTIPIVIGCVLLALAGWLLWPRGGKPTTADTGAPKESKAMAANEVMLSAEAVKTAGIELEEVKLRAGGAMMRVTGTVEANQQQTQQVTPLVSGRVERVNVALGDRVAAGAVLAVISSPEIAELRGKFHDAHTRLEIAERNFARVQRAENRVGLLQAKAKLDEADATLKRTRRLIEIGAGAGKDLIAAEAVYNSAKAEYDFQGNISLNKEVAEARAAVDTTRVDVAHVRDQLRAMGAPVPTGDEPDDHERNTSLVSLKAPASGNVTERLVNQGAGITAGTSIFTIANISTVWVVANVPEVQINLLRVGTPAEVHAAALGPDGIAGRVSYIDPKLDEGTRTAHVRINVANPRERLKVGMFAEVRFQTGTSATAGDELMVASAAVQRIGERAIVFIPKEGQAGKYEVRDVQLGGETEGYLRVLSGLNAGDGVVTKGSFTLKTRLLRGELEEE